MILKGSRDGGEATINYVCARCNVGWGREGFFGLGVSLVFVLFLAG